MNRVDPLHPFDRVRILSARLANLEAGSGDYRDSNRVVAIKECARALADAKSDLSKVAA